MKKTPRTDEQINGKLCTRFQVLAGDSLRNASVPSDFARKLERELNSANERIQRLEEFVEQLTNPKFTRYDLPKEALLQRIKRLEEALDTFTCVVILTPMKWNRALQEAFDMARAVLKAKEAKP